MKRFWLMVLGVGMLPLAYGLAAGLAGLFGVAARSSGGGAEVLWPVTWGMAAFAAAWVALPHPMKAYVLGHELTHALWALMFGARVSKLRVGESGGSVMVSKSNVWITLAPYFFPFYTFLVVLAAAVVKIWKDPLPMGGAWAFAAGFTWGFHLCFTLKTLGIRQPDVKEYGRIFSYVLIWVMNVAEAMVALVLTTGAGWGDLWREASGAVLGSYGAIWRLAENVLFGGAGIHLM